MCRGLVKSAKHRREKSRCGDKRGKFFFRERHMTGNDEGPFANQGSTGVNSGVKGQSFAFTGMARAFSKDSSLSNCF